MTTLPLDTLMARLRAQVRGWYPSEAAVELLIAHDRWLHRPDFLAACVEVDTDPCGESERAVWIAWDRTPTFLATAPCSSSESRILALAAELAGTDSGRPLADLFTGLDDHNARLALDALTHVLTRGGDRR